MGTGKTSVGKRLSQLLKKKFVDLDRLIEEKYKTQISDIFKNGGEILFREYERNTLISLKGQKNFILACGGGTVLSQRNVLFLEKLGKIYCLKCDESTIRRRIEGSDRPLVCNNFKKKINQLIKEREKYYGIFNIQIDTTHISVDDVCQKIIKYHFGTDTQEKVGL
jgi:shikimate kinase